jgi:hypothetical protein
MSAGRNTAPNVLAFNTCAQHTGWNQDGDVARSRVCLSHIPAWLLRRFSISMYTLFQAMASNEDAASTGDQFDAGLSSVKIDPTRQSVICAIVPAFTQVRSCSRRRCCGRVRTKDSGDQTGSDP